MILGRCEIQKAINEGRIVIDPPPTQPTLNNPVDDPFDSTSLNLHLGDTLSVPIEGQPYAFDLHGSKLAEFLKRNYKQEKIGEGGYTLQPNRLVLGQTKERISLPKIPNKPCIAARVEGRSSFARCGLLVHFTAPTVHAGYGGTLTLEMISLGVAPIVLRPGIKICQLIFELVEGDIEGFIPSQFQNQTTPPGL